MERFHKEVYDFILNLFKSDVKRKKMKKLLVETKGFFKELASSLKYAYHQAYEGGLADHVALVTLDAYHSAITKPWAGINPDDILIVGLCHDLDKVGAYLPEYKRICYNDKQTVMHMDKYVLRNNETQDGVILAHGGWAGIKDPRLRGITHPAIAVYSHAADMLGSHVTKTRNDTRNKIREVMKAVCDLVIPKEIRTTEKEMVECEVDAR